MKYRIFSADCKILLKDNATEEDVEIAKLAYGAICYQLIEEKE